MVNLVLTMYSATARTQILRRPDVALAVLHEEAMGVATAEVLLATIALRLAISAADQTILPVIARLRP